MPSYSPEEFELIRKIMAPDEPEWKLALVDLAILRGSLSHIQPKEIEYTILIKPGAKQ